MHITVVAVRMMQMPIHKIVHVVTMGDGRVATTGAVYVSCLMASALMFWRANSRVVFAHQQRALIRMPSMGSVQVTVV